MPLSIKSRILTDQLGGDSYFHPKPTLLPGNIIAMTLQTIGGSDYFGPVQTTCSKDNGESWEKPQNNPAFEWRNIENDLTEGVCDVVPDYHLKSKKLLAIGHNVYYRNNRFLDTHGYFNKNEKSPHLQRFIVYSVKDSEGNWSYRKRLYFDEFNKFSGFSCGCAQKIISPDGSIIIPCTVGDFKRPDRMVCSLLCDFDGEEIKVLKHGNFLENPFERGLLEPSVVLYKNGFFLTLRSEDGHGYLSTSNDGLNWSPIKAWSWEDGTKLTMSTTQQHWLRLGEKLYLIYTRKNDENHRVMRWRAPLFIAEVDTERLYLRKATEQIVFPMKPHPKNPESIGLMGNFHPLALSKTEAIVTVGEMRPEMDFQGDTLIAHLTLKN